MAKDINRHFFKTDTQKILFQCHLSCVKYFLETYNRSAFITNPIVVVLLFFFFASPLHSNYIDLIIFQTIFIDFGGEKKEEGEGEGETERDWIGCLLYSCMHPAGDEITTQAYPLTRNGTGDVLGPGMTPNHLSHGTLTLFLTLEGIILLLILGPSYRLFPLVHFLTSTLPDFCLNSYAQKKLL